MTAAKAQAVVTAITNAGYNAEAFLRDGTWIVRAHAQDLNMLNVPVASIQQLAVNQGVTATVADVEFV